MGFTFDPQDQLAQLFPNEQSLDNIPDVLNHLTSYKQEQMRQIAILCSQYKHPVEANDDIARLLNEFLSMTLKAATTRTEILRMTSSIQSLDTTKKNLVLSMKVLKRLQMLVNAYNSLNLVLHTRKYQEISVYLGAVKELLVFFKPYKSIDEIAVLNQHIHKAQKKLIDDIFIDFEDSFTNAVSNDELIYGCEILHMIDEKYKDKLLSWFYNLQLKEIRSIFSASNEAGNIDNLNRRYIFFRNILSNIQSNYLSVFPKLWDVDLELAKLFCKITSEDLSSQLASSAAAKADILAPLTKTLEFEKFLNDTFHTTDFSKAILGVFEPYLISWVNEQDAVLSNKFMEFYLSPKIPSELISPLTPEDILTVLRVNNVPNFAESSAELFKLFQKLLVQIIKLSSGKVLVDLARLFKKYLREYNYKILTPIINQSTSNPKGVESVKYLTMVVNTADYINNNITDLHDKFHKLVDAPFKEKIDLDSSKSLFFDAIAKSILCLVEKVSIDLQFAWRLFENNSWDSMESTSDTSNYMDELLSSLKQNNLVILPLIIRDGYVRSYSDRIVEFLVHSIANKLSSVRPLSIVNVEQILIDVSVLKSHLMRLPLLSDPSYDDTKAVDESKIPKAYSRFVNTQVSRLETLLKLLLTPVLPVDNVIENYFNLAGDRSLSNFTKFLSLKNIAPGDQGKYVENFKLQLTIPNNLVEESPALALLDEGYINDDNEKHPASQASPPQFDIREFVSSKSPEPHFPEFFRNNQLKNKINNPLRDFSLNGEQHVSKLNENFKNIGKFFRKDNPES